MVGALAEGVYGDALEHNGKVGGSIEGGAFLLQHGLANDLRNPGKVAYTLDFDFSSEDVTFDDALNTVQMLHDAEFSLFQWALGPKAKTYLGESDLKR